MRDVAKEAVEILERAREDLVPLASAARGSTLGVALSNIVARILDYCIAISNDAREIERTRQGNGNCILH